MKDITGQTFGRLLVIEQAIERRNNKIHWVCRCSCGNTKTINGTSLRLGKSLSCGCLVLERVKEVKITHGATVIGNKHPLYRTWTNIRNRCFNPKYVDFHRYGGRGITLCERWDGPQGFPNFIADMGDRPEGTSIDRIDNDKGYSPENCRWATQKQQCRNTRQNRVIACFGKSMTLVEWSEHTGINAFAMISRLKAGWDVDRALTTPVAARKRKAL